VLAAVFKLILEDINRKAIAKKRIAALIFIDDYYNYN